MSEPTGNVPESRAELFVSGRVQGVFFRSSTRKVAQAKGLEGYVRNLADGRVQAVFEGPENDVRDAIQWCRKGPRRARVKSVDVDWQEPTGEFSGFSVRY